MLHLDADDCPQCHEKRIGTIPLETTECAPKDYIDKDEKVKTSYKDPNAGYLDEKLVLGDCLKKSINAQNQVKIEIDFECMCRKMAQCSNGRCSPQPTIPNIISSGVSICGIESVELSVNNYNGVLQWYKDGNIIPNATASTYTVLGEGGVFWVRNTTVCDNAESAPVNITYRETCACTPQPTIPFLNADKISIQPFETAKLVAGNCNGGIAIYDAGTQKIIGTTEATVRAGNYYARCNNDCGGINSSSITISVVNTPTYRATRSGEFTRNNCGLTSCGDAIAGSTVTFIKTYDSTVSQAAADALASGDNLFNTQGQAYANSVGICTTPIPPDIQYKSSLSNPSCDGEEVLENGIINLFDLKDVKKIGYSTTSYDAITFSNALNVTGSSFSINNLLPDTYFVKLFYSASCFSSVTYVLEEPNCLLPQFTFTQAACNNDGSYVNAIVSITNASGYVGAEYATNNVFGCTLDASVNAGALSLQLPAPSTVASLVYKVRLYTDNSCATFIEKEYTVARPVCFDYNLEYNKNCETNKFNLLVNSAPIGARVKACLGNTFICESSCISNDATVNSSGIALIPNLNMPSSGASQIYTIRVYKNSNCGFFVEKKITIVNDCCAITAIETEVVC